MTENFSAVGESPKPLFTLDQRLALDERDEQQSDRVSVNGKRDLDRSLNADMAENDQPKLKKIRTLHNGDTDNSHQTLTEQSENYHVPNGGVSKNEDVSKGSSHSNDNGGSMLGNDKPPKNLLNGDSESYGNSNTTLDCKVDCSSDIENHPDSTANPMASSGVNDEKQDISDNSCSKKEIEMDVSENQDRKLAVPVGGPEIITLSDSEDEFQEVLNQAMSSDNSDVSQQKLLKKCQDQLRAEETKLILLRKLKQSLTQIEKTASIGPVNAGSKLPTASDMRNPVSSTNQRSSGGNIPPPLKRGHQQQLKGSATIHHGPGLSNNHTSHHKVSNQITHSANSANTVDRSKIGISGHNSSSSNSSGPPPLVNMTKPSSHGSPGNGYGGYQSSAAAPKKTSAQPTPPAPPPLTAEQKLTGARMYLKKQVEQALQQIPVPKPPPPEVNFLPNLSSSEFVYLIGMEEVVKQLLSTDHKDVKFVFNPFSCVQCETDFTPVWKRDKPGSKNVICEKCITSNQKKALKLDHTAKLKAVFSKALQKEQEIERRVAAGSPLSDSPGMAAYISKQQQLHHQSNSHISGPSSGASPVSASGTPSMPQLTAKHTQSASPNSQQQLTPQLHHQQQAALLQAAQAEQIRAAMLATQMALPYQLYGVSNKQAQDLHRQYLLDMINQNRSWKT